VSAAPRYGDCMRPLDVDELPLLAEHRHDQLVLHFIELADRTARAEQISDPATWSADERAAYAAGDWRSFSRLRGYSATEIADFAEYLRAAGEVDAKYGPDMASSLSHLLQLQTERI
jgi:hypothetical protein